MPENLVANLCVTILCTILIFVLKFLLLSRMILVQDRIALTAKFSALGLYIQTSLAEAVPFLFLPLSPAANLALKR